MVCDVSVGNYNSDLKHTVGSENSIVFRPLGNGPAVVLLHGTSANYAVWGTVQEALRDQAYTIALDQRGHGRSDKPLESYSGRDFAKDVVTVLDALGIEQAIVVGHSMGARNAWLTAAWFPERVLGVVNIDYTPYVETEVLDTLSTRVAGGDRIFETFAEIEKYLEDRYQRMPAKAVSRRAEGGYVRRDDGMWQPLASPEALQDLIEGLRYPWLDEYISVSHRMTHIRGVDSAIVSGEAWQQAKTVRPDDRWVIAEDSDHYVPEVSPQVVIDEIRHLIDNLR